MHQEPTNQTTDWALIARSLEGELLSSEEKKRLSACQDAQEFSEKIWAMSAKIGKAQQIPLSAERQQAGLAQINARIAGLAETQKESADKVPSARGKQIFLPFSLFLKVAASFLLIAAVVVGSYYLPDTNSETENMVRYDTKLGDQKVLALPDGSKVWLNANSTLSYHNDFKQQRHLTLNGEAFFEVVSDPDRPFVVHTAKTVTKVLGTKFNLKSYPEETLVRITVVEGKVSFSENHQNALAHTLTKNQQAIFHRNTQQISTDTANATSCLAWKNGELILSNMTLGEAVGCLSRFHKTEIEFAGEKLLALNFSSTEGMDFSEKALEESLQIITLTLGIRYEKTKKGSFVILP